METLRSYVKQGVGELNDLVNPKPKEVRSNNVRQLNDEDFEGFDEAARQRKPPPTVDQVRSYLRQKNPHRWRRMQSDSRWMQKQLRKLGYDPQNWRWFI